MAVSPTTNEEFIREVDDELRREQALTIWKRYARWIIAVVVGGLAIFAAFLWWQDDRATKLGVEGEELSTTLDDMTAGKADTVAPKLVTLAQSKTPGIAVAAKLTQAVTMLGKNDLKGAAALYGSIAADASIDQSYRDFALIRQTATEFDTLAPQAVVARLKPFAAPGNPWFGTAGEMTGIAYLRMGKADLAGATFGAVAKDETVPDTIRSRVEQLAATMGVNVTPAKGNR